VAKSGRRDDRGPYMQENFLVEELMSYLKFVNRKLQEELMSYLKFVNRKLQYVIFFIQVFTSNVRRISFWQRTVIRYLWRRPFWFTDKYGVTLRLYPTDSLEPTFANKMHFDDRGVLEVTKKILKPTMTVIDVGANYGQFTVFAAQLVGYWGQVHSFEPTSYSFQRLNENVHHLDKTHRGIHLNQIAISNQIGSTIIHEFPPEMSGWNSLNPHLMYCFGIRPVRPCCTENVRVTTLDQYCIDHNINKIDLLKIDVEGFEYNVFEGSKFLINNRCIRKIIFEISPGALRGLDWTPEDVLQKVHDMGFEIQYIASDGRLKKVELPQFKPPYFANYLATPRRD
jgi:FkbM family methyltransferase